MKKEYKVITLNKEEQILIDHIVIMELKRLDKLRDKAENLKIFDAIYADHIEALKELKKKVE